MVLVLYQKIDADNHYVLHVALLRQYIMVKIKYGS